MSASDHLNGEQLRMFIPAKELKSYNPNPFDFEYEAEVAHESAEYWPSSGGAPMGREPYTMSEFWQVKGDEAEERGTYESVGEHGVKTPVNVFHGGGETRHVSLDLPTLAHGHHRVAAAEEHDPDMLVPVKHYDTRHHSFSQAVTQGQSMPSGM